MSQPPQRAAAASPASPVHGEVARTPRWQWLALLGLGALFEAAWLLVGTVGTWLSEAPDYTHMVLPAIGWFWSLPLNWLAPVFGPDPIGAKERPHLVLEQKLYSGALVIACLCYVLALVVLAHWRGARRGAWWAVSASTVLFMLTLFASPGQLSGDMLAYSAFGRVAGVFGLNPYLTPPDWPSGSPSDWTWWWYVPTPYAPAWADLAAVLSKLVADLNPGAQAVAYKLLVTSVWGASLGLLAWLLHRVPWVAPADRVTSFALFAWNPVVLLEVGGNGHNDILMAALSLGALVPAVGYLRAASTRQPFLGSRGWWLALVLLTLAVLVKYIPAVVLVCLGVVALRQVPRVGQRVQVVVVSLVVTVGIAFLLTVPWLTPPGGPGAILFASVSGQRYAHAIADIPTPFIVARFLDVYGEHIEQSRDLVRAWQQGIVRSLFVVFLGVELRLLWAAARPGPASRFALRPAMRTALVLLLAGLVFVITQTLDYYFILPLALATTLGWRDRWSLATAALTVLFLPTFYLRRFGLEPVQNELLVVSLVGPLLGPPLVSLARRLRAPRPGAAAPA